MPKARKPRPTAKASANTLTILHYDGETESQSMARVSLSPSFLAATAIGRFTKVGEKGIPINDLIGELGKQVANVQGGNLERAESLLVSQAHTLDAIFNALASRAAMNMGEHMNAAETYLRLALKAQSQCRTTLETLAAIKNPTAPTFVKQANIAHGPQQVNNATVTSCTHTRTHAPAHGKPSIQPNELLGVTHEQGQCLDTITPQGAVGAHPSMAAVGARHRP